MQEVSIDSLQQQVCTFWGESWEVRVFLWGRGMPPPPTRITYTFPPLEVSPPLPPSSSLTSSSASVSAPLYMALWYYSVDSPLCGGGLWIPPPDYPLTPTSPPLPLISLLSLPLDPQMCWTCCWLAGAWPLGGPPPGWELTMLATTIECYF